MVTGRLPVFALGLAAWIGGLSPALAAILDRLSLADVDPLAVCVDGSPAAYYWQASTSGSSIWIVDLEGGGWCDDEHSCRQRCADDSLKCSSAADKTRVVEHGLFQPHQDPAILEANKVFLPYCTSDAHMGDGQALGGLHFRGARVVRALFLALVRRHGLAAGGPARNLLILGGQSAGARGAMVHLDYVPEMLGAHASNVDVVGFLDSPLWLDMPPLPSANFVGFNESCRRVYSYANITQLGIGCIAAYNEEEQWRCIMGEYRMPHVRTPYLLVASQYDSYQLRNNVGHKPSSPAEVAYAEAFALRTAALTAQLREAWPMGSGRQNAVISWACYSHATSLDPAGYDHQTCGLGGPTLDAAVQQFLSLKPATGAPRPLEWLDKCSGFACGPGCPHRVAPVLRELPVLVV